MKCINRVQLLGHVVRDAELKYVTSGVVVANFSLAVTESFTDKAGKEATRTNYIRCVAWGAVAESAGTLCLKGETIYAEGKIATRSWADKETGKKQYMTEVVCFSISENPPAAKKSEAQAGLPSNPPKSKPAVLNAHGMAIDDSEIPF